MLNVTKLYQEDIIMIVISFRTLQLISIYTFTKYPPISFKLYTVLAGIVILLYPPVPFAIEDLGFLNEKGLGSLNGTRP